MLTPDRKGAIAEIVIAHAAVKFGVTVLKPISEGERYDLVFARGSRFMRVQCKWAGIRGDVIVVNCRTSRRTSDGFLRTTYTAAEVDLGAAVRGRPQSLLPARSE